MARRDYALNIVADISDYQKRLAQIPGYTDKQAAKAAERLERRLSKAQEKAARDAKRYADKATKSWKDGFAGVALAISPQDIQNVGRALFDLVQSANDARNELADMSTRSGLAADTLAALRLAARGSGLEFGNLESALTQFPKRLADFRRGTGEAKVALEQLGISVEDITNEDGGLKDADEVFRDVLKAVSELESPTERAAVMTQIFGEAGTKLVQALGDTGNLDAYGDKLRVIGDRTERAAEVSGDWQRNIADLQTIWDTFTGMLSDANDDLKIMDGIIFSVVSQMVVWPAVIDKVVDDVTSLGHVVGNALVGDFEAASAAAEVTTMTWEDVGKRIRADLQAYYAASDAIRTTGDEAEGAAEDLGKTKGAIDETTDATDRGTASLARYREEVRKLPDDWTHTTEQILAMRQERLAANRELYAQQIAEEDAWREKVQSVGHELDAARAVWHDNEMARQQQERDFKIGLAQQGFNAIADILHATAGESKKAARAAAIADRASAIFGVGVNTAQAIAKSMAIFGPPVPPNFLGIAGVAAAGGIGIAQAAAIAAQPLPTFHTGTAEVPAMLTPGEAVLSPRAAEAVGRDTVDALNKGMQPAGGPAVAVLHWNRRAADRVLSEVARADGQFNQAIRSGSTVTMRTPYR